MTTEKLNFKILGMHCENCKTTLTKTLEKLKGINFVSIDLESCKCHIEFDPNIIKEESIENEITKLGYHIEKGRFQKWLDRMAKSNEKQFGSKHLECCNINKH